VSVRSIAVAGTPRVGFALLTFLVGCTTVSPNAVKDKRSSGVTRRFDRPAPELYQASVLAMGRIRADHPYYSGLEVVEQDAATGTVIAEQRLDSAVIPGLGEKDAIGIFVAEAPGDESDVTVVALASDQIPGGAGTYVASLNGAEARVFPAIESALETIPESPRTASAPLAAPAPISAVPPPSAVPATAGRSSSPEPVHSGGSAVGTAPAPAAEPSATSQTARLTPPASSSTVAANVRTSATEPIDRAYEVLRTSGRWRPLVRETRADGMEEIRVGTWAKVTESGGRVRVAFRDRAASAADAAQLALELNAAGLQVDVVSDTASNAR
jgi:hypothetical protein